MPGHGDHRLCRRQRRSGAWIHHHPLERAIAAADGIDYIKSQSALGLSTITVRLKLNYDPIKALSEISSKVDQVRNDLPPEAEVPTINVESADSQFASAYSASPRMILKQNEITDYLVRVCSRGYRRSRGPAGRHPGRPHLCHAHLAQTRTHGRLQHQSGPGAPGPGGQQLPGGRGQTKGALVQVNLTANTDLRSVEEFKRLVVRQQDGAIVRLGGHRRRGAGRRRLRRRSPLFRPDGRFHGHLAPAQRQFGGRHPGSVTARRWTPSRTAARAAAGPHGL
jgi:hypothetical protein